MSNWALSIVMIVPADLRETANRLACALGHDVMPGNTFSAPLSTDGSEPATHYGCRTVAKQEFVDLLTAADGGTLPDDIAWGDFGLSAEDVPPVLAALITDVHPAAEAGGHFGTAIVQHNLLHVTVADVT